MQNYAKRAIAVVAVAGTGSLSARSLVTCAIILRATFVRVCMRKIIACPLWEHSRTQDYCVPILGTQQEPSRTQ
jgi:hypothetical protein